MQSKNEKTGVAEEQAQNPEQVTETQIVSGDQANAAIGSADEINRLYREIDEAAKTSLKKAIRIGELLTEQRERCEHGEWLWWLANHVRFSRATADNYQRLYRERAKLLTVSNLTEAYRLLAASSSPEWGRTSGDRVDPATRPPAPVRPYIKVHFRNAPDRDKFARLMGLELYDHTREVDFRPIEDVVIDLAPVLDHNNQLLAAARAQWIQFCESQPLHLQAKLAQTQVAMLLAIYVLYQQDIAPPLPFPAEAQTDVPGWKKRAGGTKENH